MYSFGWWSLHVNLLLPIFSRLVTSSFSFFTFFFYFLFSYLIDCYTVKSYKVRILASRKLWSFRLLIKFIHHHYNTPTEKFGVIKLRMEPQHLCWKVGTLILSFIIIFYVIVLKKIVYCIFLVCEFHVV